MIHSVTMPLPPTLNEQIRMARSHWSKGAKQKKEWTHDCAVMFAGMPITRGKVWVAFDWHVKNFGRDSDNISAAAKFIMDGMVEQGTIRKDSLMVIQSPVVHHYHRSKTGADYVVVSYSEKPIYQCVKFEGTAA